MSKQIPAFRPPPTPAPADAVPSSSPAFATPAHPIRPFKPPVLAAQNNRVTVLPVLLPPPTLRPLAFRTFTKKHSLTLTSSALQVLATFVGRHCGTGWKEDGLAEKVLEEVARNWKSRNGGVIVDGESNDLKDILKTLEGSMIGGRIVASRDISRQNSLVGSDLPERSLLGTKPLMLAREDSFGMSKLGVGDAELSEEEQSMRDPRMWLRVIDAFEQPRMIYNMGKRHFERDTSKPSLLPPAAHKTQLFRNRYNLVHQRLLRNDSFQAPTFSTSRVEATRQNYQITPIANLLGRNGSTHMLLGLLTIAPTGTLAICDLTGSIALDLTHAKSIPEDCSWFTPGMIVLVDGTYEEDDTSAAGGDGGVGGTVGGKFRGFYIGGAPCEKRQTTLGVGGLNSDGDVTAGGGFGWVDFLGVGSERAVGNKMRRLKSRLLQSDTGAGRGRMVIIGEVNLDIPRTLQALRKILSLYSIEAEEDTPMTFVLLGNFTQYAIMARGAAGGSIEYKEYFDALASLLSDFPTLLQSATFVFVPGDNDGWASSFSAGAAVPLPRTGIPDLFTSRIKRAFASANAEAEKEHGRKTDGQAIWTSNPSRLSVFGPAHEIVLFRDNMTARLRRTAVKLADSTGPTANSNGYSTPPPATPEPSAEGPGDLDNMDMDIDALPSSPPPIASDAKTRDTPAHPDPSYSIHTARKLVKTILDQGYLSPFHLSTRPVLWDYASSLQLYPLPTALVLADPDTPAFCITYEGCHVMNPACVVAPGRRGLAKWIEYDVQCGTGRVRETTF